MESYSKSLVDKKIEEIKAGRNSYEIGLVTAVKEYILTVRGLENAVFMERVLIGNGAEGYVNAIRRSEICVTVVKSNGPVFIGDQVRGTGETYKAAFALSSSHLSPFENDCYLNRIQSRPHHFYKKHMQS